MSATHLLKKRGEALIGICGTAGPCTEDKAKVTCGDCKALATIAGVFKTHA